MGIVGVRYGYAAARLSVSKGINTFHAALFIPLKYIITMAFEKDSDVLPPPQAVARPPKQRSNPVSARRIASAILLTIGFFHLLSFWSGNDLFPHGSDSSRHGSKTESLCPQVKPLFPNATNEKLREMEAFLNTSSFLSLIHI